jgi:tetratricopeptide (TPR) repeat protein
MRALRLEVALPAAVAFMVGAATGLTIGWVAGKGGQVAPAAQPTTATAPSEPAAAADEQAQLRQMLAVHEKLLADDPESPTLLRTVGTYHSALGEHDEALGYLEKAEENAQRAALEPAERAAILTDLGIVHAERGDVAQALEKLRAASSLDPGDARSRLAQVYVYLTRVMPNPPPGTDRKQAVATAEALLAEALAIEPTNADALQFKALLDSVRKSRAPTMPDGEVPPGPGTP